MDSSLCVSSRLWTSRLPRYGTPACPLDNATRRSALPPDKAANLRWRQTLIRGISYSPWGALSAVSACSATPFNVHAEVPAVRVILPRCDSRFLTIRQLSQGIWEITAPLRGRVSAVTGMRSDIQRFFFPLFMCRKNSVCLCHLIYLGSAPSQVSRRRAKDNIALRIRR